MRCQPMKGLGVTTVNALRQSNKRLSHRYGDGYVGPSNRAIYEMYLAELRAAGKDPARARVMGGDMWLIVADDPDRTFATYAPHLLYWFNAYSKWFEGTDTSPWPHLDNAEELLSRGLVNVVTPDAAIKLIKDRIAEVPGSHRRSTRRDVHHDAHAAGDRAQRRSDEPRIVRQKGHAALQVKSLGAAQLELRGWCGKSRATDYRRSMNTRSFAIHIAEFAKSINFTSSSTAISIARRPSGVFPIVARSARSNHASA